MALLQKQIPRKDYCTFCVVLHILSFLLYFYLCFTVASYLLQVLCQCCAQHQATYSNTGAASSSITDQPAQDSVSQTVNKLAMLLTLALEWSSYRGDWAQAPATTEIPAHSLQTQHLDMLAYNTAQSQSNTLVLASLISPTSKASIHSLIRLFTSHSGMVLG